LSDFKNTAWHRRVQKVLRIVKDAGIISLADLSRKTQWLALRDRREIISQLIESGTLIDVFRDSKTRPARGLTADITTLRGSGWQLKTPKISERKLSGIDQSIELSNLQKRVAKLEAELENLMECTRVEIKELEQQ
jgi:vacuolar-type H+-ATPase subunit I/STV1